MSDNLRIAIELLDAVHQLTPIQRALIVFDHANAVDFRHMLKSLGLCPRCAT